MSNTTLMQARQTAKQHVYLTARVMSIREDAETGVAADS